MADALDILVDDDDDIQMNGEEPVVGYSDEQHIQHILTAAPGHYKLDPVIGANVYQDIQSPPDGSIRRRVKMHLTADNYEVSRLIVTTNNIEVDAKRR